MDYLSTNGYVMRTAKADYDKAADDVARLSQLTTARDTEMADEGEKQEALAQDEEKEHSFMFHLAKKDEKDELSQKTQAETTEVSAEATQLGAMEDYVNQLIQEKSKLDRMVPYNGEYLSLTDVGVLTLSDLNVREYRVADEEFPDFVAEILATYTELRSIAAKASSYVVFLKPRVSATDVVGHSYSEDMVTRLEGENEVQSLLWGTGIGLAKLQGDVNQIGMRFAGALDILQSSHSTTPNKLMAAEIMTSLSGQDLHSLGTALDQLDKEVRSQHVPKELSAGVAATIMAAREYDGTYPMDRFIQFEKVTKSYEAAAILAALNVPSDGLTVKFEEFRTKFTSWGYMTSDDTEIASAFLAIGELDAEEVGDKLAYIVEQLKNYLEYPLVAAAILASIPIESHEVLDLMEKAVTLLTGYTAGLERSQVVTLAVRMIHGVRNELVKQIDSTAKTTETPVQFTYAPMPGLFFWYFPLIIAYGAYGSTFSAIGGFHPAHSHGIGGFAG